MHYRILFSSVLLILLGLFPGRAQQTISLGDYDHTTEHFEGSVGQKAPFDFDYRYSRSQQLYTAEDLVGLEGKEITEIRMRVYNQDGGIYIEDYQTNLRLYLTNTEQTVFEKREGETKYRWAEIDREKDLVSTMTFKMNFIEQDGQDFEVVFRLDKPFVYTGKTMLMTVESEANQVLNDTGQSFVDFYAYPKNLTGLPVRTLFRTNDQNNVAQPSGYGEFAHKVGLKHRAVLKITYRTPEGGETPATLDPVHPVVTVKTAGTLQQELASIQALQNCLSLTIKGEINATDIKYAYDHMSGIERLDLRDVNIVREGDSEENTLPQGAFSKHPALQEVILPESLLTIGRAALSDMPKLRRVVMGSKLTTISYNAFALSAQLAEIEWSPALRMIYNEAFKECKALRSVSLPDGVTAIGQSAFYGSGLESFRSPKGLTIIDRMVFHNCKSLQEVDLSEEIEEISYFSFGNCTALTRFTIRCQTPPTTNRNAFKYCTPAKVTLVVPNEAAVETYKKTMVWKDFGQIIPLTEEPTAPTYTLTFTSSYPEGTLRAFVGEEEIQSGAKLKEDTKVRVVANPKEGYILKAWIMDGVEIPADSTEFTLTMTVDTQLGVRFEAHEPTPPTYTLNFTSSYPGGTLRAFVGEEEIQSGAELKEDTKVRVVAEPKEGYRLKAWLIDEVEIPADSTEFTLTMTVDTQLGAIFEAQPKMYTVTYRANNAEWGRVHASIQEVEVVSGSKQKADQTILFSALPKMNYHLRNWVVNGKEIPFNGSNEFEIVLAEDVTVEAIFERDEVYYDISLSIRDNNGGIMGTVDGVRIPLNYKAREGSKLVVTAMPEEKYELAGWTVNGKPYDSKELELTFVVDQPYRIEAAFKRIEALSPIQAGEISYTMESGAITLQGLPLGDTLQIYSATGEEVVAQHITAPTFTISLESGYYIVVLRQKQQQLKVIIP